LRWKTTTRSGTVHGSLTPVAFSRELPKKGIFG
jgi:hypothetical protein